MSCERFYTDFEGRLRTFGFDDLRLIQAASSTVEHTLGNQGLTTVESQMELWTAIVVQGSKIINVTASNPADGKELAEMVINSPATHNPDLAEVYRKAFATQPEAIVDTCRVVEPLEIPNLAEIPQFGNRVVIETVYAKESAASYRIFGPFPKCTEMHESRNTVQVIAACDGCRRPLSFRDVSARDAELFWKNEGAWQSGAALFFGSRKMKSMPEGRLALGVEALRMLMQSLSPLLSIDAHAAGQGLFGEVPLGSKVMGDCVSVLDEPRSPSFPDVYPFDMQGVSTHNRALIASGRLSGLLGSVEGSARARMDFYGNAWSDMADPIALVPMSKNLRICVDSPPAPSFDYKIIEFLPETVFDPVSGFIAGEALGLTSISGREESVIFPVRFSFLDIFTNPQPIGQARFCRGFAAPEISFNLNP